MAPLLERNVGCNQEWYTGMIKDFRQIMRNI